MTNCDALFDFAWYFPAPLRRGFFFARLARKIFVLPIDFLHFGVDKFFAWAYVLRVGANGAPKPKRMDQMTKATYGDFVFDSETFPIASTVALLSRGLSHYLGNEVSARVGASFKKDAVEAWKAANPGAEVTKEVRAECEASAIPDTDSEAYLVRKASIVADFIEALRAGTVGVRERAVVDPFEAEVASLTKGRVVAILRTERKAADGSTYKLWSERRDPKAEDIISTMSDAPTFGDLMARHLAKHRAEIEKAAKKALAEREAVKTRVAKADLEEAF